MIRRKNMTIFTNATEHTSVKEVKNMIEGIIKVPPANQKLYKDNTVMLDYQSLSAYGITSVSTKPQCPALIGLAICEENGQFEPLSITPYSIPPDLPDVMKSQENSDFDHMPSLIPKH
ncbi:transcription elongation factor elongin B isoform X2 [Augochlora pura]